MKAPLGKYPLLFSWLKSFLLVMICLICFILCSHLFIVKLVRKQISKINQGITMQVRTQFDSRLEEVRSIAVQIRNSPDIIPLLNKSFIPDSYNSWEMRSVVNLFRLYHSTHIYLESVFMAVPEKNFILSVNGLEEWETSPRKNDFTDLIRSLGNINNINSPYGKHGWLTDSSDSYYFCRELGESLEDPGAYLFIKIDKKRQNNLLKMMNIETGGFQWISDGTSRIIFSSDEEEIIYQREASGFMEKEQIPDVLPVSKAIISYSESEVSGLHYFSVLPEESYSADINQAKKILLLLSLCIFISGIIYSIFFTIKNYLPLKGIIKDIEQYMDKPEEITNEYRQLEYYSRQLMDENRISSEQLNDVRHEIQRQYFERLLKGELLFSDLSNEIMEALSLTDRNKGYFLIKVKIHKRASLSRVYSMFLSDLNLHSLPFVESTRRILINESVFLLAILNKKTDNILHSEISDHLINETDKMEADFGYSCLIILSGIFKTLNNLHPVFKKCEERYAEAEFFKEGPVVTVNSSGRPELPYIDPEKQQVLISSILEGSLDPAVKILENIFGTLNNYSANSKESAKCIIFSLFSTITQTINIGPEGDERFSKNISLISDDFFNAPDMFTMKEALIKMVEISCSQLNSRKKSHNSLLLEQIINFIDKQLGNSELYLPMIADAFGINKNYLSNFFKEQKGQSLPGYIREKRIRQAAILIKNGVSIKTAAEDTGFTNPVTFNRAFRKIKRITPSRYREEVRFSGTIKQK